MQWTHNSGSRARSAEGASAVEYGLIVFAIAAVITVIIFGLGKVVKGTYTGACSTLDSKASTGANCAGN